MRHLLVPFFIDLAFYEIIWHNKLSIKFFGLETG
jgi:hypothetical protein